MIRELLTIDNDLGTRMANNKQCPNLDALIHREDLEIAPDQKRAKSQSDEIPLRMEDLLKTARLYKSLRKPDFQRETCNWTPQAIAELVKNQLDGELIPAVILWSSPSNEIFVIDGAHRLSALIAWVNDDYGDREISHAFFGPVIDRSQELIASETRKGVEREVKSFKFLSSLADNPEAGTEDDRRRGNYLARPSIKTQWVTGDAARAEASFVRINQGGAVIDATEKEIIAAREKPEGLAARALLRAGTGHQYWWKCSEEIRNQIVTIAKHIHQLFYKPEENTDGFNSIPVAGRAFGREALAFLFEIIHVANGLKRDPVSKKRSHLIVPKEQVKVDMEEVGKKTVEYLMVIQDLSETIFSKEPRSLGLHPAVYCRSATGKFQPSAYLAQILLVQKLEKELEGFHKFTKYRAQFEEFLIKYKYFINQIVRGIGAGTRSLSRLAKMHTILYDGLRAGLSEDQIKEQLIAHEEFAKYLSDISPSFRGGKRGDFSSDAKDAIKMRTELDTAPECPECGARLHVMAAQFDHDERRGDGGSNQPDNGNYMHPFCNAGVKERRIHRSKKTAEQQPEA